jgi:hypothetical protein
VLFGAHILQAICRAEETVHRTNPAELLRSLHRGHDISAMLRLFRIQAQDNGPLKSRPSPVRDDPLLDNRSRLLESQEKDSIPLFHLLHSDDLK